MTSQLLIFGILGIATTIVAFWANWALFTGGRTGPAGPVSLLEGVYYAVGVCSVVLGWYFNVRYTHLYPNANYVNYTKMLFTNWAADSAAQDYVIVNVVLAPAVDHRRRAAARPAVGLDLLRHQPVHQPGLLRRAVPGVHGAPVPLQPRAGGLQHVVAAVVAGNEGDAGTAVASGATEIETLAPGPGCRANHENPAGTGP